MSLLDATEIDAMRKRLAQRYAEERQWLIQQLEVAGYPYGQVPMTQEEQLQRYLALQPQDWVDLRKRLMERYRGLPDARDRVEKDLTTYMDTMERLRLEHQAQMGSGGASYA